MPAPTRTNLGALIALLALVAACGGTAVAAGVAKDSVTSKSIKNNAVKSKDLKDSSVESVDVADGSLGSKDVADGSLGSGDVQDDSLASADVKGDGLTGADIAESTLGIVPNATAVGGVQVTPLSVSLPSGAAAVPVLSQSGTVLSLDCTGSLTLTYTRAASGPPVVFTSLGDPNSAFAESLTPGETTLANLADGQFTAAIVSPGGGSVTAAFAGIYELNANSGANDCFYRGTITRVP